MNTKILGLDPGSYFTGFGVVNCVGSRIEYVEHGVIQLPAKMKFENRLQILSQELQLLLTRCKPQIAVVERIFLGRNVDSAFKLGHTRGVCLLHLAQSGCQLEEHAARSVKKGITGRGSAAKEEVQKVLYCLLGIQNKTMPLQPLQPLQGQVTSSLDASDALALAFYQARQLQVAQQMKRAMTISSNNVGNVIKGNTSIHLREKEIEIGREKEKAKEIEKAKAKSEAKAKEKKSEYEL